ETAGGSSPGGRVPPQLVQHAGAVLTAGLVLATLATPNPIRMRYHDGEPRFLEGIGVERDKSQMPHLSTDIRREARAIEPYWRGLDVSFAFSAAEAQFVYLAGAAVAIECMTGLTDAFIARQPLEERGFVGHEKNAPID